MNRPAAWFAVVGIVVLASLATPTPPAHAQAVGPGVPPVDELQPQPEAAPGSAPSPSASEPGMFDVSGQVGKAIDNWFAGLVTSAINPVLDVVGRTLLSAPDVTQQGQVRSVWFVSLGMANTVFVLLAIGGGVLVMTHETVQSRYSVKEVAPRLLVAVVLANTSLLVAGQAIELSNALSRAFLGEGLDPDAAVGGIGRALVDATGTGGLMILLALVATGLAVGLACVYLARAAIVVLLVAAAPVALACHALPQTERIAILWWKSTAACLGVQVAQSLVLVTTVRVFFAPDGSDALGVSAGDGFINLLTTLCLFWIMLRIPTWAGRIVFGPGGGPVKVVTQRVVTTAKTAAVAA